jgi:hypothetical protein
MGKPEGAARHVQLMGGQNGSGANFAERAIRIQK